VPTCSGNERRGEFSALTGPVSRITVVVDARSAASHIMRDAQPANAGDARKGGEPESRTEAPSPLSSVPNTERNTVGP
jgi:hypothetical protein